jgi:hypothetical protein
MNEKPRGKSTSKWLKFGIPIAILVIVGLVVGLVVGLRAKKSSTSPAAQSSAAAAASSSSVNAAIEELATGKFAMATNSLYMVPLYPQVVSFFPHHSHILGLTFAFLFQTDTAVFTTPTFASAAKASLTWPTDTFSPATPAPTAVRPDRPRLIAPQYKWDVLASHIAADPYLAYWNESIFDNATVWFNDAPVVYFLDGGNGILDIARRFKQRAKAFAYAYRMTNDTKWQDRLWVEIQVCSHADAECKMVLILFNIRMSPVTIPFPLGPISINGTLVTSSIPPSFLQATGLRMIGYTTFGQTNKNNKCFLP